MPLTAEQHASIAASYDKAASDVSLSEQHRAQFAKKADWFRQLARLEAKRETVEQPPDPSIPLETPRDERKSGPKYLLASLWLIGAALFLTGTLLFTMAVNPVEDDDKSTTISKNVRTLSNPPQPQLETNQAVIADHPQRQAVALANAERRHAISPDDPRYESPALSVPPSPVTEEPSFPSAPSQPIEQVAAPEPGEALMVTANATVRNGPSTSARKIGTASPGAALQVKAREGDWVQFVDPDSRNTGWIHSSLVGPAFGNGDTRVAATGAGATTLAPEKPTAAKKGIRQKPSAKSRAARQQLARPDLPAPSKRRYADLPDDEEFLPPPPRPGILMRRRMLREGLMSPGFLPPR